MVRRPQTPLPARPSGADKFRRPLWLGLALLGLVLLAYAPALSAGFIWDDDDHLTANPCIVGPLGLQDIWTSARMRICPLVQTTFWLIYRVWQLNPLPYHLVNILLHGAGALVLWRVLRVLRVPGAWLGAALWALHPVQVESVAWITEMKNTQSGLFFLLAVLFFCKSRQTEAPAGTKVHSGLYYGLTLVFAVLALASKSSTVVLPLVLGLCAWWLDRAWHWRRNLLELAPLFLLSALTGLATIWTQQVEGAFGHQHALGWAERLALAGKVIWFYAGKLIWPHPLLSIYPRWQIDGTSLASYLPTLAAGGLLAGLWWQRNRGTRTGFFAYAFFVAALLPVLGLIDTYFWRYSFVGDHFQYLASMGPLALAGAGLYTGFGAGGKFPRRLWPGMGAALVLTFGLLTWQQCGRYRSDETLWTATLQSYPDSWLAHSNLGVDLDSQPGREADAVVHYEESLRLNPENAKAHYNLARNLARNPDRRHEAMAHYEAALRIDPTLSRAQQNLAVLLASEPGREAEAVTHYAAAVRLTPGSAEAHYNLASELGKWPGREAEAIAHYREALRLQPDYAEAHNNLALALAKQPGGAAEAADHFEAALRLRPDWAEVHNNYALLLSSLPGRLPEAIAHYEEALRLRPDAPMVHNNLAGAYYRSGRLADAISHLEIALKLDPGYESARRNLTALRQQLPP